MNDKKKVKKVKKVKKSKKDEIQEKDEIKDEIKDESNIDTFKSDILSLKKTSTINRLTKYEKTRIIGIRATQIQNGMSPVFIKDGKQIDIPDEYKDIIKSSVDIAKLELKLKSCPLIIKRKLPSGKVKKFTVQELY